MRTLDAHLFNFTVLMPRPEAVDEVTLEDVHVIDW